MFWVLGHKVGGILAFQPEIEPILPELEGEVLTSGPPGKCHALLKAQIYVFSCLQFLSGSQLPKGQSKLLMRDFSGCLVAKTLLPMQGHRFGPCLGTKILHHAWCSLEKKKKKKTLIRVYKALPDPPPSTQSNSILDFPTHILYAQ